MLAVIWLLAGAANGAVTVLPNITLPVMVFNSCSRDYLFVCTVFANLASQLWFLLYYWRFQVRLRDFLREIFTICRAALRVKPQWQLLVLYSFNSITVHDIPVSLFWFGSHKQDITCNTIPGRALLARSMSWGACPELLACSKRQGVSACKGHGVEPWAASHEKFLKKQLGVDTDADNRALTDI